MHSSIAGLRTTLRPLFRSRGFAALASLIPALRASRIQPAVALREE